MSTWSISFARNRQQQGTQQSASHVDATPLGVAHGKILLNGVAKYANKIGLPKRRGKRGDQTKHHEARMVFSTTHPYAPSIMRYNPSSGLKGCIKYKLFPCGDEARIASCGSGVDTQMALHRISLGVCRFANQWQQMDPALLAKASLKCV